ncbi:MAG TPA: hypothetical protein DCW68_03570 [Rhodospirillaceae bacterium]|nr:MAG: hypothetical protein A2018_07650 [Alphaproteobacteria bacterium GWF2_58_20]HAU29173.1 hypothetical protein [Rhodospirillaceae bacterium]
MRHRLASLIFALSLALPLSARAAGNTDISQTFFAGAFFDLPPGRDNQLTKYLVRPVSKVAGELAGDEMTPLAQSLLSRETDLVKKLHLVLAPTDASDALAMKGNPVAVYLSRAQHETLTYSAPGTPSQFLTVFSVALTMDIFTDKAAMSQRRRLESIYSKLFVGEQSVVTDHAMNSSELATAYRDLFAKTLHELAIRVATDRTWDRDAADAVFQFTAFNFPSSGPPAEIRQLVESAIGAEGRAESDDARNWETERFKLELLHTLHQFVSDELRRQNLSSIALMSPPSPWAQANVGSLLANRMGMGRMDNGQPMRFYVDSTLEETGTLRMKGKSQVLGYTISAGLAKAGTSVLAENKLGRQMQFSAGLAARIQRPNPGGKPKLMPTTIENKAAKTPTASGAKAFEVVTGVIRPTTREIAMDAIRAAAHDLAPKIVALMQIIADDPISNR